MAAPDLGSCLSAGINGLKKDPATHIVTPLLIGVVSSVSAGLLAGPMIVGYMRMLQREEQGAKVEIADVFKGFDDFVPALLAVLVSSIIVAIGYMLCFLPGLLITALVPISAYLVAMGEKDGINAVKRAVDAFKANFVGAFVCMLVLGIVGSLGAVLCGVGIILTMPIAMIGSYHLAKQVTDGGDAAVAITLG